MAQRFDATTDQVGRAGALPDPRAAFMMTGWVRIVTDRNDYQTIARLRDAGGSTVGTFATQNNGTAGPNWFTVGGSVSPARDFAVGLWCAVAVIIEAGACTLYWRDDGAEQTSSASGAVNGAPSPAAIALGGRGGGDATEWYNGDLAQFRIWSSLPASADRLAAVEAEWASWEPVWTSGLYAAWPLIDDLLDVSGNDRHLTAGATPTTTVDDPPIPAPALSGAKIWTGSGWADAPAVYRWNNGWAATPGARR